MLTEMVGGPMCGVLMEMTTAIDEIRFPVIHAGARDDIEAGIQELAEGMKLPPATEYLEYERGHDGLSASGGILYFFKKYKWPSPPPDLGRDNPFGGYY